jgi:hypothetical protein
MKYKLYYTSRQRHSIHLLLMCFVVFCASACKKEKLDTQLPQIVIHAPTTGSTFHPEDIIVVSATITDDSAIEKVRVQIVNASNESFLLTKEFYPNGSAYELNTSFVHDDMYLTSGNYYVKITAFDKSNEKIEFRQIQLTEVPVELKNILLIRSTGSNSFVDTLSGTAISPYLTLSWSHQVGAISSRYQYLLSTEDDHLNVMRTSDYSTISTQSNFSSTILNAVYDENSQQFYSTTIDGYVYETNRHGYNSIYAYLEQQRINDILVTKDYIFLYHQNLSNTIRSISVIKKSTRTIIQSLPIQVQFQLVKMIYLGSEDKILLAGNQGEFGTLIYYNRSANALNNVYTFYDHSPIYSAWNTAPDRFIIAQQSGMVNYTYSLEMLTTGIYLQPKKMVYEKLSNMIYAYNETGVYVLNINASSIINFIPYTDCKDLLILYNK